MSLNLQTVETTANLDENGVLHVKEPIRGLEAGEVLVIVVARPRNETPEQYDDSELTPEQWNKMLMQSSAFKEWADPAEDIYTLEDGQPIEWDKGWATYRVGQRMGNPSSGAKYESQMEIRFAALPIR